MINGTTESLPLPDVSATDAGLLPGESFVGDGVSNLTNTPGIVFAP